ncbi:hypothetical protein Lal_00033810 [Lupinus albus]|nr:hypothetical protein Lal_00033810 [Lupinus albus]
MQNEKNSNQELEGMPQTWKTKRTTQLTMTIEETIKDNHWSLAMQEELQFERNKVRDLVPRPNNHPIIGTKCVFRNKLDESSLIIRNKSRIVANVG